MKLMNSLLELKPCQKSRVIIIIDVEYFGNITLPISSDDPTFELLDLFLDAYEGGDIPESAYVDPFDTSSAYVFDLFAKTNKYLGEDLYFLSSEDLTPTKTISNEIDSGDNLFNPFATIGDNTAASFVLSSSSIGATAGSTLDTADIIWQFVDGKLEGAWYKKFDEEFVTDTTCIKIPVGSFEMRYPFADRGLSGEDIGWTGIGIDNCQHNNYISPEERDAIEELYWADDSGLSSANSIALMQTSLIADGAGANENIFKADQIQIKPNRESTEEQFAWLFDFNHTELPISCGLNQIYWPLFRYSDETQVFPFNIPPTQAEDRDLKSLHMTKDLCGATAGLTPNTGDRIFKNNGFCGVKTEGAWLSGCDVGELGYDIYDPAIIEDICGNLNFELSGGVVFISGECISAFDVGVVEDDPCGSEAVKKAIRNVKFSGKGSALFTSVTGQSGLVYDTRANYFSWGSSGGIGPSVVEFNNGEFTDAPLNELFELGEVSFFNGDYDDDTAATAANLAFTVNLGDQQQRYDYPITINNTVNSGNQTDNADSFTIEAQANEARFTVNGIEYTLLLSFGEIESGGFVEDSTLYAFEGQTAVAKLMGQFVTEDVLDEVVESTTISYRYQAFNHAQTLNMEYTTDVTDCILTIIGESTEEGNDTTTEEVWVLSTDGLNKLFFYSPDLDQTVELLAPKLIGCYRNINRSISSASRQSGLHMVAAAGKDTPFIWEFPDADPTDVLNGYDHDDHCNYNKITSYSSAINAEIGDDVNQWKQCNCKSVYYSPVGNDLEGIENFDNNREFSDVLYVDSGPEPFSYATWVGPDGKSYRESDYFAVFKYSGVEPDSGYGIGFWQTLSGKPFTLEQGQSYVYRRASFGGCDENQPPCFVVRNCHCFDKYDTGICDPVWIKLIQDSDGEWVSTGEVSDMVLESGQFYEYEKRGEINYKLYKNGQYVDRSTPTPSFSLNVTFQDTLPYWAESPTIGALNIGLSAFETDDYLLTTQPKPSEAIIENDSYINYVRNTCEPLIWKQPINFTVDFQRENQWQVLDFSFANPPLLKKLVGCGSCDFVFDNSPNSCYLQDSNCEARIGNVVATNTPSNMVIRTAADCGSNTEIYYSAQTPFTFTQEVTIGGELVNPTAAVYMEASRPWANYINGPEANIRVEEDTSTLKTEGELGVFKPQHLGVTKVQCFGKDNKLV